MVAATIVNLCLLGAAFHYPTFYTGDGEYLVVEMDDALFRYTGPVLLQCQASPFMDAAGSWNFGDPCNHPNSMNPDGSFNYRCREPSGNLACDPCVRKPLSQWEAGNDAPMTGPGSAEEWAAYYSKGLRDGVAGPGGDVEYVYPIVIIQAGQPLTGLANMISASLVWQQPANQLSPCDKCSCLENDGVQWAVNATPASHVGEMLYARPTATPTQFWVEFVVKAALRAQGLCELLTANDVDKLIVEYGPKFSETWLDIPIVCGEIQEQEGQADGEGAGGGGEGQTDDYGGYNPFEQICDEPQNVFPGYDIMGVIDPFRPFSNFPEDATDASFWGQSLGLGDWDKRMDGAVLEISPTTIDNEFLTIDELVPIRVGGSVPDGGEACAIKRDGVVIAYKEQAIYTKLPVANLGDQGNIGLRYDEDCTDGATDPLDEGQYYWMWSDVCFTETEGDTPEGEGSTSSTVDVNGGGFNYPTPIAARPSGNAYKAYAMTHEAYYVQRVKDSRGRWWRIYLDGKWCRWEPNSGCFRQTSPPNIFNGEAILKQHPGFYSRYASRATAAIGIIIDANTYMELTDTELALSGGGAGSGGVRMMNSSGEYVDPLSKQDMTEAVAQGTAAGIAIAGNNLASKIADAISSGFVNQPGGGLGYGNAPPGYGYPGGSGAYGNVSFDGSIAGGGSGSDTGRAGGEGEGYGTAGERIRGSGMEGGKGEGGLGEAQLQTGVAASNLTQDIESFVATPVAPVWHIDVPWLDGESLSFTVDFSGATYGFGDQVYGMVVLFRSFVLVVFVAWWAWCLMRPLLMEGW